MKLYIGGFLTIYILKKMKKISRLCYGIYNNLINKIKKYIFIETMHARYISKFNYIIYNKDK